MPLDRTKLNIRKVSKKVAEARFYNLNSILGNDWAIFYVVVGGR